SIAADFERRKAEFAARFFGEEDEDGNGSAGVEMTAEQKGKTNTEVETNRNHGEEILNENQSTATTTPTTPYRKQKPTQIDIEVLDAVLGDLHKNSTSGAGAGPVTAEQTKSTDEYLNNINPILFKLKWNLRKEGSSHHQQNNRQPEGHSTALNGEEQSENIYTTADFSEMVMLPTDSFKPTTQKVKVVDLQKQKTNIDFILVLQKIFFPGSTVLHGSKKGGSQQTVSNDGDGNSSSRSPRKQRLRPPDPDDNFPGHEGFT
ncbi:unnamed protein product, partial [Amoebophrya sp. A120]